MLRRVPLIRRTRIRQVSPRRATQNREYRTLRAVFLAEHPWCEFPGCGKRSTDVHHRKGRIGRLLLAVEHWSALCRDDHAWVTEHPAEAIRMGLSETRIGRAS